MEDFSREKKICLVSTVVLAGFAASVFFHYIKAFYMQLPYPHNTFLLPPSDRFNDFFNPYTANADLDPYLGRARLSAQYPVINMLFYFFSLLPRTFSFMLYSSIFILSFLFFNYRNLSSGNSGEDLINTFVFSFMTYPFLLTVDRGNVEGLLCILLLSFMHFFRQKKYLVSSVILSVAVAVKLFPIILATLFIDEKKYRYLFLSILSAVGLTAACLALFRGGFVLNWQHLTLGFNIDSDPALSSFLGQNNFVQRGVTLFTFCKVLFVKTGVIEMIDMSVFLKIYKVATTLLSVLLAGYILLVEKALWKKAALLVFAMLLFPPVSADYKLLHLFLPMFLFFNARAKSRADVFYALAFGLLLIPKDYYLLSDIMSDALTYDISIAVLLNPIIMLVVGVLIISEGLRALQPGELNRNAVRYYEDLKGIPSSAAKAA